MKSFVPITGSGEFILKVNGNEAKVIKFDKNTNEALTFDLSDYIKANPDFF